MTKSLLALSALFCAATLANPRVADIKLHAQTIEKESQGLSQMLKSKQVDAAALRDKLDGVSAEIDKLKAVVAEVDPAVTPSKDWMLVKEKVQLIEIFHQAKRNIVNEQDVKKNRSLLRAHAQGVAKRAAMLQQTAGRLAQP
jgi:outer membrane protein TolC